MSTSGKDRWHTAQGKLASKRPRPAPMARGCHPGAFQGSVLVKRPAAAQGHSAARESHVRPCLGPACSLTREGQVRSFLRAHARNSRASAMYHPPQKQASQFKKKTLASPSTPGQMTATKWRQQPQACVAALPGKNTHVYYGTTQHGGLAHQAAPSETHSNAGP
jgi:hypothetical protein